ncbi:hypothetical protein ACFO5R_08445 [Halosolutus amylolyticus]|uniref:Blue (type 1) copper domain-containing protein n=1 Tax=Halosolutus amylolyticus TaxID=2932267 RepID=A0ABD5PND6_9EURY|nr:twin-arginine translocation signal domain-containing protein [Halosolutus amylolyticus]
MTTFDHDRRSVLKLSGATIATALAAGCLGDDENERSDDTETGGGSDGPYEIEPGERITFRGEVGGWIGLEPVAIEDVTNPTLVLEADGDYEIGWTEGDNTPHNFLLWDENEDVVEDYETEQVAEPDDDQILEITATDEMAYYRCEPHQNMQGEIQVE